MKNGFLQALGALVLFAVPVGSTMAAGIGSIEKADGIAQLNRGVESKPISSASVLQPGDTLKTGQGGKVQWSMADDSVFIMSENSAVRLDEFSYDSKAPAAGKSRFSLLKGAVRGLSGLIAKANPAHFKLETPVATMGVRGTDFIAVVCNKDCSTRNGELFLGSLRNAGGHLVKTAGVGKFADGSYVTPFTGTIELCNAAGCESLSAAIGGGKGGCMFAADGKTKPKVVSDCPIPDAIFEGAGGIDRPGGDPRSLRDLRSCTPTEADSCVPPTPPPPSPST
jgi:hypothetical protein